MTAKDSRREIRLKKRKMKDRVENKDDNLYWQITQIYIQKTLKNLHQKPIHTSKFSKMANTRLQAKWVQRGYTSAQ